MTVLHIFNTLVISAGGIIKHKALILIYKTPRYAICPCAHARQYYRLNPMISRLSSMSLPYLFRVSTCINLGLNKRNTHSSSSRKYHTSRSSFLSTLLAQSLPCSPIALPSRLPPSSSSKYLTLSTYSAPPRPRGT